MRESFCEFQPTKIQQLEEELMLDVYCQGGMARVEAIESK